MTIFTKAIRIIAAALALLMAVPMTAGAVSSYQGYVYDFEGNDIYSINPYLFLTSIDGTDMESGPLKGPEDLFIARDSTIYVVESGNNRVLHINAQKQVLGIYGDLEGDGALNGPKGVFVTENGDVYVSDTLNRRIAKFDKSGQFIQDFGVPESPLLPGGFVYSPSKLIVDKRGYMFVVSEGTSQGLLQLKPDGTFAGFFGANHVPYDWTRIAVRLMASEQQREQLSTVRPPEFSSIFQDAEGFIYTTTLGVEENQVKRLSAVGVDTLNMNGSQTYGDLYLPIRNNQELQTAIVDVSVNANGIITALDRTTGRLFQYNKLGDMLFAFGGFGNQDGLFKTPTSVAESPDGMIYVADQTRNRIDVFYPTPFAQLVHKASELYVDGKYEEAFRPWQQVLELNSNYDLAYYSIGKALYRQQRYKEAMSYFKIVGDQADYSNAFKEYRKIVIREQFGSFMSVLLALMIASIAIRLIVRNMSARKKRQEGVRTL
ncbi:tetratricopeptide repeat protein [Paenibacillus harenae]|uniref:DNA-binding beta-propeller fold protein YncE n=1 Tax=Paenibacillus harenae TaxID=306543 RepID=A0ABT9U4A2_PAEHA|nr:tetratricopeptide repeat protein [Paenibacillus harenae]MDQ0114471.1 DNA-binding beta-propeller fold protein YncE [Paenibacillus harenae]